MDATARALPGKHPLENGTGGGAPLKQQPQQPQQPQQLQQPQQPQPQEAEESSYLARIEVSSPDPIALFNEWRATAAARGTLMVNTMVLATVNKRLEVSARTVVLRRLDGDAFVFMTDKRSRKAQDLEEHPRASLVFGWWYRQGARVANRQVRVGGPVRVLAQEDEAFGDLYTREPLYCKVRSHLCEQGAPVTWERHAERHDQLLAEHRAGRGPLDRVPDHVVAYRLEPEWIEFYEALDDCIGDRVHFSRAPPGGPDRWLQRRLAA